jgi:predicted amidohydrolase YtcJ
MYSCCSRPVGQMLAPRITPRDLIALRGAPSGPGTGHAPRSTARLQNSGVATPATADTIFWGGPILSLASPQSTLEAIAIQDGRIVALGDRTTVMGWQGPSTTVVDLDGRTLLPGFVEPHLHVATTSLFHTWIDVTPFTTASYDAAMVKLRAAVAAASPGDWVTAFGYDSTLMTGPPQITRDDLDAIAPNNPVFVLHISEHNAYVNSLALQAAKLTDDTPDPPQGRYLRDAHGRLRGVAEEVTALAPLVAAMPRPSPSEVLRLATAYLRTCAATGCTTVNDAGTGVMAGVEEATMYAALAQQPDAPVRISCFPIGSLLDQWGKTPGVGPGQGNERLHWAAMKYWADGSTQGGTAALRQPYLNAGGGETPSYLNYTFDDLLVNVRQAHNLGWQVTVHCNGDAAVDQALDVFETVLRDVPRPDHRHRIDHCTVADEAQMERMHQLGLSPSFLINHVYYWGRVLRDNLLGPERAERLDPAGSAVRLGMPFSLHCDAGTTPVGPLSYVQTAVTRCMRDTGEVLGPAQRVSVEEALKAVTCYPAWQLRMDHLVGSLEVGKRGDLVLLDQDPRAVDPTTIGSIQVVETWLDGQRVGRAS